MNIQWNLIRFPLLGDLLWLASSKRVSLMCEVSRNEPNKAVWKSTIWGALFMFALLGSHETFNALFWLIANANKTGLRIRKSRLNFNVANLLLSFPIADCLTNLFLLQHKTTLSLLIIILSSFMLLVRVIWRWSWHKSCTSSFFSLSRWLLSDEVAQWN